MVLQSPPFHFGSRDEFNVKCDCEKNKSGVMLKRLVRVFRVEEAEEALLFAITCFDSNGKVMIQGNHRELWVDNKFPILKTLIIIMAEWWKVVTHVVLLFDYNM